ncbi:MAG: prohibitin family protein, partial [Candidatus Limnocylindrales bacterium]
SACTKPAHAGGRPAVDLLSAILLFGGVVLLAGGAIAAVANRTRPAVGRDKVVIGGGWPASLLLVGGAVAPVAGIVFSAFIQIPAGFVGVVRQFGAVTGVTLDPGLHFVTPIVNSVDQLDTRVKAIRVEGYTASSKEQQDLFLDATLNYHVDPRSAPRIVQDLGLNFEETIIRPRFLDIPKSVTDDYPTAIVLNSRDEIRTKATELLRAQLEPRGIIVDGISFENFSYSVAYNQAIEEKQAAQQQVETERQRLAQQEIIAQQKVAAARGEAESQIERARGEAESNRLVGESLTPAILQNRYIEKLSDQIQVMLLPSEGGGLILDLGSLTPTPSTAPSAAP